MIQNAELNAGLFARHLLQARKRKSRARRALVAGLMLTSMVDMFSLLVIFLLQNFSTSPEMMAVSKAVKLPAAMSASATIDAPVLTVTTDEILLDQKTIGTSASVLSDPRALFAKLDDLKKSWLATHKGEAFKGDIHLQADKELASTKVAHVVSLLNSQGYASVHLAVVSGGGH